MWDVIALKPLLNGLIVLSQYLWNNFGLSIVLLTVVVRLVTLPLTVKQTRATKAIQAMQPKMEELKRKYARDQQTLSREMMKLYRESGMNPMGCLFPMLIQLPIWIALYQSIIRALAATPESLLDLSQLLYSWPIVHQAIPVNAHFLWLDLAQPDRFIALPILVGASMWVMQKMVTPPVVDPRQQSTNTMMLWMMPAMFALISLQFPSGLALYWVISNVMGIIIQYFITGWGGLLPQRGATAAVAPGKAKSATNKQIAKHKRPK
ncbi:MAG TPA: membrane protein insertase YidC [Dehalococcoidia bacterium]|nr:membrane protein insertase YidC [Dehalococcoidia bacterium]